MLYNVMLHVYMCVCVCSTVYDYNIGRGIEHICKDRKIYTYVKLYEIIYFNVQDNIIQFI